MIRISQYIIGILIIITAFSCEKTKYKSKIVQAYQIENENNGNSLKISNLKVLEIKEVGYEYGDTLTINHYLNRGKINHQVINNIYHTIELLESNIVKYKKLLKIGKKVDFLKYERELKDTELRLQEQNERLFNIQDEIEDDNLKIYKARNKSYENNTKKFKLVEYIIVATTDSIQLNDTLSIVFNEEMKWSFVKNDLYCNYLGE